MADFPQTAIPPLFISTYCRDWMAMEYQGNVTSTPLSSQTWTTASRALYIPFWLPWPYPVRRVFWHNGSSVTSTNRCLGIYTASGTLIYSTGSTAAVNASVAQYVTPTEFMLTPGRYYLGIATDTSTANRGGAGQAGLPISILQMAGVLEEAAAFPLPATMTPITVTMTIFPFCGITRTASGF